MSEGIIKSLNKIIFTVSQIDEIVALFAIYFRTSGKARLSGTRIVGGRSLGSLAFTRTRREFRIALIA